MTVAIIGGSGFVSTRLVKRLLDAGHQVKIADKRETSFATKPRIPCSLDKVRRSKRSGRGG